jgi:RNA polymerase sigma factor (sigma-70 family)
MPDSSAARRPEELLRTLAPQVLGVLARRHHDFGMAEDAVQEAVVAAATQWPVAGLPANPRGWLYHVATRRLHDAIRQDRARRRREEIVAAEQLVAAPFSPPSDADVGVEEDDTLLLLFMCCHPALTPSSAVALTLRAVGGLTTAEIAHAFLVPEATMAQRISRAKGTIKASDIPLAMPHDDDRTTRLTGVLHTLYLIFSEGYTSSEGQALHRTDLSDEAIRLARMLHALVPQDAEVTGLLALMLLTDARRGARTGPNGELVPLDEQDRTRWNAPLIAEGVSLVSRALPLPGAGQYTLQAAIAAVHDEAAHVDDTDWPQIEALYRVLLGMSDNPMVALNHAIAASMVHGPAHGLALLERLDGDARLRAHHRLDAVRGHLHERAGDVARARLHYQMAAGRTASIPERDYLLLRAARLPAVHTASDLLASSPDPLA